MQIPAAKPWPRVEQPRASQRPHAASLPQRTRHSARTHAAVRPSLVLWLVVYVLLNVGDLVSTYVGLRAGLREANPLMSGLLAQSGFGALIAYKLAVIVAVVGGAIALIRMHPRAAYLTVHVCNGLVFLAVFLNVAQMLLR